MTSPFDDYRKLIRSYPKLLEIEEDYIQTINAHIGAANTVSKEFNEKIEKFFKDLFEAGNKIAQQFPSSESTDWQVLSQILRNHNATLSLSEIDDVLNYEREVPSLDEIAEYECGPLDTKLEWPDAATIDKLEEALEEFEAYLCQAPEPAPETPSESVAPISGSTSSDTVRALFKRSLQDYADSRAEYVAHQQRQLEERAKKHAEDVARDIHLHEEGQISTGELERRISRATREYFLTPAEDVDRDLAAMKAAKQLIDAEAAARSAGVVDTSPEPQDKRYDALAAKLEHLRTALQDLQSEVYGKRR